MHRRFHNPTPPPSDTKDTPMDRRNSTNPFRAFHNRRDEDRIPLHINSRALALKGDDDDDKEHDNPFQRQRERREPYNSRFGNMGNSFRQSNGRNQRGIRHNNQSYFRRSNPPKKKGFNITNEDFPPLGGKKVEEKNKVVLSFMDAAKRGEKCPTPPPSAPLPPPERLARPKKRESDNESIGWDTEDEKADREMNPSDNEEEEEEDFWGKH